MHIYPTPMRSLSHFFFFLGVTFLLLGVLVVLYPELLIFLVSLLCFVFGFYIIGFGWKLRRLNQNFSEFKHRFFINGK